MTDKPIRKMPPPSLEPGYNPINDPTVRALLEVPLDDEALRNELERVAIEPTDNGPKDTDRAVASQRTEPDDDQAPPAEESDE